MPPVFLSQTLLFEWDAGNTHKNRLKHDVTAEECEQAFQNRPLLIAADMKHSQDERRYIALGKAHEGRTLFIAFTLRKDRLRVISARDMSRKERGRYEEAEIEADTEV
jgi:uncharacterized protein